MFESAEQVGLIIFLLAHFLKLPTRMLSEGAGEIALKNKNKNKATTFVGGAGHVDGSGSI